MSQRKKDKRKVSKEISEEPEYEEDDQIKSSTKKNEVKFRVSKITFYNAMFYRDQRKLLLRRKKRFLLQGKQQRQILVEIFQSS